jgi:hypothetical protein
VIEEGGNAPDDRYKVVVFQPEERSDERAAFQRVLNSYDDVGELVTVFRSGGAFWMVFKLD